VKSIVAGELKLPNQVSAQLLTGLGTQKQLKLSLKIPQQNLRLFSFHSKPMTFVTETDQTRIDTVNNERDKLIENIQLSHSQRKTEWMMPSEALLLPVKFQAQYHMPRQITQLKEIVKTMFSTENNFTLDFLPVQGQSPREITINFIVDQLDTRASVPARPWATLESADFSLLDNIMGGGGRQEYMKYSQDSMSTNRIIAPPEPKMLKHQQTEDSTERHSPMMAEKRAYKQTLSIIAETVGGSQMKSAEIKLEASCDPRFQVHIQL